MEPVVKIMSEAEYTIALSRGEINEPTLQTEGYIRCCTRNRSENLCVGIIMGSESSSSRSMSDVSAACSTMSLTRTGTLSPRV